MVSPNKFQREHLRPIFYNPLHIDHLPDKYIKSFWQVPDAREAQKRINLIVAETLSSGELLTFVKCDRNLFSMIGRVLRLHERTELALLRLIKAHFNRFETTEASRTSLRASSCPN